MKYHYFRAVLRGRDATLVTSSVADAFVSAAELYSVEGYLLVLALTAGYAFLNRGYAVALVLGSAPKIGAAIVYVDGARVRPFEVSNATVEVGFQAVTFWQKFPQIVAVGTLGFLLGLAIQRARSRQESPLWTA